MSPSTTAPTRRKYAPRLPREVRREQILDATISLAVKRGWHGVSMEAVAERAGVAKSVSYAIFGSQAGLVRAVIERGQQVAAERLADVVAATRESDGVVASLTTALTVYLECVAREPEISMLILLPAEAAPDSLREAIREGRERARREITILVEQLLQDRGIEGLDADLIGHLLHGNGEHLARLLLEDPKAFTPQRLTRSIAAISAALVAVVETP